jgi:hypothetical protein
VRELHQKQNIMLNESEMMMIQILNRAKADTDAFQLSMTRKEAARLAKKFGSEREFDGMPIFMRPS